MNNQTKQTNADYKQIMNSKSVQEMKGLILNQRVNRLINYSEVFSNYWKSKYLKTK